jgi:hypothetical protein
MTVAKESIVKVKRAMVRKDYLQIRLQILQNVSIVQQVGRQKLAAPSVNLVRLELPAASKVNRAKTAPTESIVKVRK